MLESFHGKKRNVTAALSELASLADQVGARSLSSRVETDLIQKLEADRFHLVVVGEFNHGKTTFVNALLGGEILPVGVTPTTAVIHHVEYSEEPRASITTMSGEKKDLGFPEIRRFMVGADSHGISSSDIKYLEVGFPAPLLRERIVLVDTPGVNDLSLQRADITYSYIPRSDAVLFLLDAGQPLKESERVFLQEKLLGQSRSKIIFVVTKCDIWDDSERKEALSYIETELGKLIKSPKVFPVSAERAIRGEIEQSGMPELIGHLTMFLAEERGRIVLDNALGEGMEASKVLRKGIEARRRAAQMTTEEISRRVDALEKDLVGQSKNIETRRGAIREEIAAIKAWVRRDLDRMCEDVVRQLPAVIDNASAKDIKQHLGPFLEKAFTEWAQSETKEIATALEALAEKTVALVKEDAHDAAKRVSQGLGPDMRAPNVEVDTFGYDVGVVALFTVGFGMLFTNALLGGLLTVAAPVLAMYVKGRVENETRQKARELAPGAMRAAAAQVAPKLEAMIQEFADRLDAWVVTAGEELHREIIEVLTAARSEREDKQVTTESATRGCDEQLERLEKVGSVLEGLRGALWAPANGEPSTRTPMPSSDVPNAPGGSA